MSGIHPLQRVIRIADLPADKPFAFEIVPEPDARRALADALNLISLKKLRFGGSLSPLDDTDWALSARLGATVVQPCSVTLEPVTTWIDETVERRYLAEPPPLPTGDDVEMPEDDSIEPLPSLLDLSDVLAEALALALPTFPRSETAEPTSLVFGPPGAAPLTDAAAKPFAGLAALRNETPNDTDE